MSRAAMMRVERVRPEMGLLDEPIVPTRFPETAAKKNPATAMTTAAMRAERRAGEDLVDEDHEDEGQGQATRTTLMLRSFSSRDTTSAWPAAFLTSPTDRLTPVARFLRIL